jgi:hypothetical protein
MPRRAPDGKGVTEHRITFGNYEREFVTDIKNDVEKTVKVAAITAAAVPLATVAGLGLLGYGIYKGATMIGKGLNEFQMLDWSLPGSKEWEAKTEGYSWYEKQSLWYNQLSGGSIGLSQAEILNRRELKKDKSKWTTWWF